MKIAVPVKADNQIDNHFGHCEYYRVFSVSDENDILSEETVESPKGCGCKSDIAADLATMGVRVMLAGGIGQGAINKLAASNIEVVRNCKGDVNLLILEYLAGNVVDGGASCSSHENHHHEHEDGHVCNHTH